MTGSVYGGKFGGSSTERAAVRRARPQVGRQSSANGHAAKASPDDQPGPATDRRDRRGAAKRGDQRGAPNSGAPNRGDRPGAPRRGDQRGAPRRADRRGALRRDASAALRTQRREPPRPGPAVLESVPGLAERWPDVSAVLKRQPWDDLTPHLRKVGGTPSELIPRLRRYCELVLQWNRKVSNLISRNDEPRIVLRHLIESIEPAHWLQESGARRWLDFGSGAGFPAIPLALAGVEAEWTLVESRRTKTLFLRKASEDLEMNKLSVVLGRLEDLVAESEHAGAYDGFTSRATQTLGPTLELAASFVQPGGKAFLWKGSRREEEMAADDSWRKSWDFDGLLGIGDGATTVARFTRK